MISLDEKMKQKLWQLPFVIFGLWLFGLLIFSSITLYFQPKAIQNADLIVVLTGDAKRISAGMRLFTTTSANTLLISGVGSGVQLKDFIPDITYFLQYDKHIILGRLATNTEGNAIEAKIATNLLAYNRMCVVTSDYHMLRSYLLFRKHNPSIEIEMYPLPTDGGTKGLLRKSWLVIREYNATLPLLVDWGLSSALYHYDKAIRSFLS